MNAAWVAGSVRARAMARRRLGFAAARELAAMPALQDAIGVIAASPYGLRVHAGDSLAQAQRGIGETLLWHLRVMAGWLPAPGAELLRLFAGWFELSNLDGHLHSVGGGGVWQPYRLGTLATAWPVLAQAGSRTALRRALAASPWGDPGGENDREIQLAPRVRWAERIATRIPQAADWASSAVVLLVAREMVAGRPLPPTAAGSVRRLLGPRVLPAASLAELHQRLPARLSWILAEVSADDGLWRAEARWWSRLRSDGARLLSRSGFGQTTAIGAVAVLADDAFVVRAALELAAFGGQSLEVLDALA